MKAIVKTDYWKSNLSEGDLVTDSDFAPAILMRADQSGYVEIQDEDYRDKLKDGFPYVEYLRDAGYQKHSEVNEASDDELLDIDGIGPVRLSEIRGA